MLNPLYTTGFDFQAAQRSTGWTVLFWANLRVSTYPVSYLISFGNYAPDTCMSYDMSDFTETNNYKNNVHICYTYKKRMEISFIKMKELYQKKDYQGLKLDALNYYDRSQAVILNIGVPISNLNSPGRDLVCHRLLGSSDVNQTELLST